MLHLHRADARQFAVQHECEYMPIDFERFSLPQLISKLHAALLELVDVMDGAIMRNKEIKSEEINKLRAHISERLKRNEDIEDNKKLIQVLDLFKRNSTIIELVKEDAEDWLDFLDTIEERLKGGHDAELSAEELKDIERIKKLSGGIKKLVRK